MNFPEENNTCCKCSLPVDPVFRLAKSLLDLDFRGSFRSSFEQDDLPRRPNSMLGRRSSYPEAPCSPFVSSSSIWGNSGTRAAFPPPQMKPTRDALAIIENWARRRRSCATLNSISSSFAETRRRWKGTLGLKNQIGSAAISRKVSMVERLMVPFDPNKFKCLPSQSFSSQRVDVSIRSSSAAYVRTLIPSV